ncbi:MAG: hypothetical protein ABIL09_25645 [Gemmatimonadota bacterium]
MRESFLRIMRGEPAEGAVWTADITYWITGEKAAGRGDPAWDTEEGYLALHRDLGVMPYYFYEKFWVAAADFGGGVTTHGERVGDRITGRIHTPVGDLVQESAYLPTSCSTGTTKHFVETPADLDVLLYVLEHRTLHPTHLEGYASRRARWAGYDGLPSLGLPRSPLPSFAHEWAGVMNATYLMADCEDRVARALALMEAQERPIVEAVCRAAPPVLHFPDNLSSANLTGWFDAWMAGPYRRRLEPLHEAGVKAAVHLDGTVRGLLPRLAAVGFDAVESITPAPVGDVTVEETRAVAGSASLVLWGGVPGAMFAPPFTWEEMEAHVARVLEHWGRGPFVLGVADQVPPNGDMEFCRRIGEMVRAWRRG